METCSVGTVSAFESLGEILWCDYSYETSSAVLLHGTDNLFFNLSQNQIWDLALLGATGLNLPTLPPLSRTRSYLIFPDILVHARIKVPETLC